MNSSSEEPLSALRNSVLPGTPDPVTVDTRQVGRNYRIFKDSTQAMRDYVRAGAQPQSVLNQLNPERRYDTMQFAKKDKSKVVKSVASQPKQDEFVGKGMAPPVDMRLSLRRVRHPWTGSSPHRRKVSERKDWSVSHRSNPEEFSVTDFETPIPTIQNRHEKKEWSAPKPPPSSAFLDASERMDARMIGDVGGKARFRWTRRINSTLEGLDGALGSTMPRATKLGGDATGKNASQLANVSVWARASGALCTLDASPRGLTSNIERPKSSASISFHDAGTGPHGRFCASHSHAQLLQRGIDEGTIFRPSIRDFTFGALGWSSNQGSDCDESTNQAPSQRGFRGTGRGDFDAQSPLLLATTRPHTSGAAAAGFFESAESFGPHVTADAFVRTWKTEQGIYTPTRPGTATSLKSRRRTSSRLGVRSRTIGH